MIKKRYTFAEVQKMASDIGVTVEKRPRMFTTWGWKHMEYDVQEPYGYGGGSYETLPQVVSYLEEIIEYLKEKQIEIKAMGEYLD
jgi:hypothetical protein